MTLSLTERGQGVLGDSAREGVSPGHREGSPRRRQVINQTSVNDIFVAVIPYD